MAKNVITNLNSSDFDPPLVLDENHYSVADYLRPMLGGAAYAIVCSVIATTPMMLAGGFMAIWIFAAITVLLVAEMAVTMGIASCIHHRLFVHRLRKYGPGYYASEINIETPPAEAFELCLAATSDLPKSKILKMDEKNRTLLVAVKGNFWITVDRQVLLRVRHIDHSQSVISVDPSIKLSKFRRGVMRFVWGDKWYPLIFRSDINWNRKILNSVTSYIESVPNWDHKYDQPELCDHGFAGEMHAA